MRSAAQYGDLGLGSVGSAQKWNSSLPTAPIGHRHWKRVSCVTAGPAPSRPSSSGAGGSVLATISPAVRDSLLFIVSVTADKCIMVVPARAKLTYLWVRPARWRWRRNGSAKRWSPTTLEAEIMSGTPVLSPVVDLRRLAQDGSSADCSPVSADAAQATALRQGT